MNLVLAIAALCSIGSGGVSLGTTEDSQRTCQNYYAKCLLTREARIKLPADEKDLLNCIMERK